MVKRHLILTWLILAALLLPSAALGALREHGSTPDALHTAQGEAKPNPQAPETLTWRQRTAEEWAAGAFEHTAYTPGNGVALTRTVFKLAQAGDYDDKVRGTSAMVAFDADADGDADLVLANSPWPCPAHSM